MSDDTRDHPANQATAITVRGHAAAVALGLVVAIANIIALVRVFSGEWTAVLAVLRGNAEPLLATMRGALQSSPEIAAYLAISPLVLALLVRAQGRSARTMIVEEGTGSAEVAVKRSGHEALGLLRLLQEEARFADFIGENIDAYDDAQVGAAARAIHAGCRKALAGRLVLRRILEAEEGARVTVDRGFDPAEVRLTGNVRGEPPFSGVVQHAGWRAVEIKLPEPAGKTDSSVIAPAEVEVG